MKTPQGALSADDVTPSEERGNVDSRTSRLRSAIKAAGGSKPVSEASGVPVGTISNYLLGREMRASAMIALARACRVNLQWLATGDGPMKAYSLGKVTQADAMLVGPAGVTRPAASDAEEQPPLIGDDFSANKLGASIVMAMGVFAERLDTVDPGNLGRIVAQIYDTLVGETDIASAIRKVVALLDAARKEAEDRERRLRKM